MTKTISFARHQAVGAYRRWEPPDFGAPPPSAEVEPEPLPEPELKLKLEPEPEPEPESAVPPPVTEDLPKTAHPETEEETEPEPPSIPLPTAEEIEQIHEEARRSGFDEGLAEGLAEGYKQGSSEGRETGFKEGREAGFLEGKADAENEARQLRELVAQLEQALTTLDAEIAEELMSLAIELARKIIQHTLAVEPQAVVSAIRAVLQTMPQSRAQIHLNPEDIALARSHLGEVLDQAEHVLIEDETVSRGGCRVETPGAQIDATMETRWRRTIESLGKEHSPWLPAGERRAKTRRPSDKSDAKKETKAKNAPAPDAPSEPSQ